MPSLACDAVWINGSVGAGKTTAAEALGTELERRGVPGAVVDVDWLRRAWPAPADDRFNSEVALANLRAVAGNSRERGARHGDDAELDWHLHRHPELTGILDRAGFRDEVVIDTTALTPDEVAAAIAARVFPHTDRDGEPGG